MFWLPLLACATPSAVPAEAPVPTVCVSTWSRTSGNSLLREQRGLGGTGWADFPPGFSAGTPGNADIPAVTTAAFTVDGQPVFFFRADLGVVNKSVFGQLTAVDATTLSAGERVSIGTVTPAGRAALGDRRVAELLVQADVIRIYAHLEGEACLVEEHADDGTWTGRFTGEHTYFTNGEHHGRLAFTITIAADGAIVVEGMGP